MSARDHGPIGRGRLATSLGLFAVVTILALAVRLVFVLGPSVMGLDPTSATTVGFTVFAPYTLHGDALFYDHVARALLAGEGYVREGRPTGIVPPGYPLFVALVYGVSGGSVLAVGVAQAALGALTAGAAALIALRLSGIAAGYAAGSIIALYPHLLIWTQQMLTETLFIALAMLALWALVEATQRASLGWAVAAGVGLGAAGLVRTEVLPFIPLAALLGWRLCPERRAPRAAILLAIPLLFVGPWIARNAVTIGVASPATESATVLWSGYNPRAAENHRDGYVFGEALPREIPENASEAEVYAIYMDAVMAELRSRPHEVITLVPSKAWNMFRPAFGGSKPLTMVALGATWGGLLALSAIGAIRGGPRREMFYVYSFAAVVVLVHLVTIAEIRYRMPVEAVLAVPAGVGAATVLGALRPLALRRPAT